MTAPAQGQVARLAASLAALGLPDDAPLGLAVSGGPDSLALAMLAARARPGRVRAASVDHGLSPAGADWARQAGAACAALGIPHEVLTAQWPDGPPARNRQAAARAARYGLLDAWMAREGLTFLATAHHQDDQAETLLMRLARGAGLGGLAAIRARRPLAPGSHHMLLRPLLDFTRDELAEIVAGSGLAAIADPANVDPAHDRTRARTFLAAQPDWPDRSRMAASAAHLADAAEALDWATGRLMDERCTADATGWHLRIADLPTEFQRRLLHAVLAPMEPDLRGDAVARALARLHDGDAASLGAMLLRPDGDTIRVMPAPPRRA